MSAKDSTSKLNRALIVLLVLQGAILAFTQLTGPSGPQVSKPKKLLGGLDTTKVTAIKIVDGADQQKVVELRKLAGKWVLESGGGYPTKKDKVKDLLAKLPALTAGAPVSTEPAHHRKLEVHDKKFQRRVTLTVEGKDKPIALLLGSSPGLKRVHLRFAGKDEVYSAGELSTWDVGVAAYDWVDTSYFKVDKEAIVALALKNSHGEVALSKADGKWQLAALPPGKQLKQSEVDSLLGTASSVAMQRPVGKKVEPAQGLDDPAATLSVVTEKVIKEEPKKDGAASQPAGSQPAASQPAERRERETHTIKIGAKSGEDYFAKASSKAFVVTVGSWLAEQLTKKKPADFVEDPKKEGDDDKAKGAAGPASPMGLPPGIKLPGGMGGHGH